MAKEKEKKEEQQVDFYDLIPPILATVESQGGVESMDAWRRAFPEIDFMEVDDYFSMDIDWEQTTTLERAIYVVLMQDEGRSSLRLELELAYWEDDQPGLPELLAEGTYGNSQSLYERLPEGEIFWWHWLAGSFKALNLEGKIDEAALPERAKKELFADYLDAIAMDWELRRRLMAWFEHLVENANLDRIEIRRMKIVPVPKKASD